MLKPVLMVCLLWLAGVAPAQANALDLLEQLRHARNIDEFELQHVTQLAGRGAQQALFIDILNGTPAAVLVTLDRQRKISGAAILAVGPTQRNAALYAALRPAVESRFGADLAGEGDSRNCTGAHRLNDRRVALLQKNVSLTLERAYPLPAVLLASGALPAEPAVWSAFVQPYPAPRRLDAFHQDLWQRYRADLDAALRLGSQSPSCQDSTGSLGRRAPLPLGATLPAARLGAPDAIGLREYRSMIKFEGVEFYDAFVMLAPQTRGTQFVMLKGTGDGAAYMALRKKLSARLGRETVSLAHFGADESLPTTYRAVWEDKRNGVLTALLFEPAKHQLSLQYGQGAQGI